MDNEELRKAQEDLDEIMHIVHKEIAGERARSPDDKTDLERKLSYMSVDDWFKPFTI